ncbi:prepilin-type N-terminal cleavage/methylation domain-containing protein [Candidatus Gracilibacteria bacterium]|nr:prepilin-type N-terminal cleavage/methylation domain-containing protein [Candidatus Gracilibacteria bacterium]NUJ98962.1 prepilin-type N-terminal cleavage/methylation domain-containing protein [Candidatus Gracilibacteria bacterium]
MKNNKFGFTLVEILVVIAIIGILALGFSRINYKAISDRQMGIIFTNRIVSILETIRNNSLLGKGIPGGEIPSSRTIDIPYGTGKTIITSYENSGGIVVVNNEFSLPLGMGEEIRRITCRNFGSGSISENITTTGSIKFEKEEVKIFGCSDDSFRILELRTKYRDFEKTIIINSINGVIEVIN